MAPFNKKLMVLAIVVVALFQVKTLSLVWHDIGKSDFGALYVAGKAVLQHSEVLSKISARWSPEMQSRGARPLQPPDGLHPPFELLLFAPLATLPYRTAFLVWYGCNLLMLASVPVLLWSNISNLQRRFTLFVIPLGTCFPVVVTLVQGQDSILLLLLLTLCFVYLNKGCEFRAGAALALGMFKFMLILPIVAALVVARKWRILTSFGSGCVALLLVSFALIGPKAVVSYIPSLYRYSRAAPELSGAQVDLMPNMRGLLAVLVSSHSHNAAITAAVLIFSIIVLTLVINRWVVRPGEQSSLDLRFSMLITATAVTSYHFFVHNASILLLPILLGAQHFADPELRTRTRVTFTMAIACLYLIPYLVSLRAAMSIFFCASVALMAALYESCIRSDSPVPELNEAQQMPVSHRTQAGASTSTRGRFGQEQLETLGNRHS